MHAQYRCERMAAPDDEVLQPRGKVRFRVVAVRLDDVLDGAEADAQRDGEALPEDEEHDALDAQKLGKHFDARQVRGRRAVQHDEAVLTRRHSGCTCQVAAAAVCVHMLRACIFARVL